MTAVMIPMKVTVAVEIGDRVATEQRVALFTTRQAFRDFIGDIAVRMELSTFGPPSSPVPEMSGEDKPINLDQPGGGDG